MTEQRPPVDFDAQKAADRVAELIAEGSVLARGWAERFSRRREDPTAADTAAGRDEPVQPPMAVDDPWSAACDDAAADPQPTAQPQPASDPLRAGGNGFAAAPGSAQTPAASAPGLEPAAPEGSPELAEFAPDDAEDVDALLGALRATVARRLGVPTERIRVTVALEGSAEAPGGGGDGNAEGIQAVAVGRAADAAVVPSRTASPERDPIDALTATLDELAARARTRLSEELGVRLPDIIAEIRFPSGGRPSVRIRPSARAGSGTTDAAGTPDLEAIVRRLLLGRDAR